MAIKKLTDEEFQALAAKSPNSDVERADDDEMGLHVVVRNATRLEWKNYRSALAKAEDTYVPQWTFSLEMLLYPTAEEYNALLDRKPGALYSVIKVINDLSGVRETVDRKKASRA